ncbi:Protein of unknown function [Gryllus bimaculatus]|nr:Protein of unknown function [Gryllus bimaculatus]
MPGAMLGSGYKIAAPLLPPPPPPPPPLSPPPPASSFFDPSREERRGRRRLCTRDLGRASRKRREATATD